ncbi:MAG: hypothetical protein ACP5I6_06045 [Caldisphaera sp.]|nr:MAG: hypothetical protein C0172_03305 [Caldisphaera sp.]
MKKELKIMILMLSILMFSIGIIFGITGMPIIAGLTITIALILYLVSWVIYSNARYVFLGLMIGGDIGSMISIFSHPLILPFVIIERGRGHESIDIDFVQIISFLELIYYIMKYHVLKNKKIGAMR